MRPTRAERVAAQSKRGLRTPQKWLRTPKIAHARGENGGATADRGPRTAERGTRIPLIWLCRRQRGLRTPERGVLCPRGTRLPAAGGKKVSSTAGSEAGLSVEDQAGRPQSPKRTRVRAGPRSIKTRKAPRPSWRGALGEDRMARTGARLPPGCVSSRLTAARRLRRCRRRWCRRRRRLGRSSRRVGEWR